ncbi:pectin lyase-like protein [Setomelanomma holmii]|uniref:pectinesterase n=1 Tax=Setomelanomma holmii TaxID=210430 RepID=A0A9P4H010_9PLEO|nr:pectin lyase-like protein [Setomelanomma holmii]
MRSLIVAALLGLASAQSDSSIATTSSGVTPTSSGLATTSSNGSSKSSTLSVATSASAAGPRSAITVAADGSGQFTAINAAVNAAQISGIPTVMVLSGTYSEAVTVPGTATVTIIGATGSAAADWSQNQQKASLYVTSTSSTATTSEGTAAVVVSLRGNNIAFYGCSIVSPGITAVSASYGLAFFANSYIEGAGRIFYNVPTIYVYISTIVPLTSGGSIVFSKGANVGTIFSNSSVVIDSCSVQQKPGGTTSGVFLTAPNNGAGAVAIYRNTALGNLISTSGFHSLAATYSSVYGEFMNSGAGSYAKNAATRPSYDIAFNADQVSQFTVDKIYANAFSEYASSSVTWLDQTVLSALQSSDASQLALYAFSAPASSSAASSIASTSASGTSLALSSSSVATESSSLFSASSSLLSPSASSSFTNTASPSAILSSNSTALITTQGTSSLTILSSVTTTSVPATSTCSAVAPSGTLIVLKNPGPCEFGNVQLPMLCRMIATRIPSGSVRVLGATSFTNDYTQNQVRIEFFSGRLTNLGQNEQTPVIYSKKTSDNSGLAIYNIDFVHTYPQTTNTAALAADFYGANIAAYGCSFIGFQDTLLANKGTEVFSNCYIEGSVDFVWGFSTAYFHQCMVVSNTPGACIAAHSRATADAVGGYVFDSCMVTYSYTYGSTYGLSYFGRPYSQYSIAVYMNSYIDKHIKDAGWSVWSVWSTSAPQTSGVLFGEYNNTGPGSWQATTQRASFASNLTAAQAAKYELAAWIGDTTWLDMTTYNAIPSYSLTDPSTSSPSTSGTSGDATNGTTTGSATSTSSLPLATATVNAHPDSGSAPPQGAVTVALDGSHNASFTNLTAALASLPKDSTNQTIFLYTGSYNEQIPSINRPGAIRIIGYTSGNPGQSYKDNAVTITFACGLSVSPLPTGQSDAETATLATASNRISLYNINMINSDNLDGSTSSYVTLAASVYGNDIAFYGCSFDGWQDTLLTGATNGYQYYESCYIGGAIDFI